MCPTAFEDTTDEKLAKHSKGQATEYDNSTWWDVITEYAYEYSYNPIESYKQQVAAKRDKRVYERSKTKGRRHQSVVDREALKAKSKPHLISLALSGLLGVIITEKNPSEDY